MTTMALKLILTVYCNIVHCKYIQLHYISTTTQRCCSTSSSSAPIKDVVHYNQTTATLLQIVVTKEIFGCSAILQLLVVPLRSFKCNLYKHEIFRKITAIFCNLYSCITFMLQPKSCTSSLTTTNGCALICVVLSYNSTTTTVHLKVVR